MTMPAFPPPGAADALEQGAVLTPRFDANGLIAAIATDAETGEVLMLAWMNAESLALTRQTGEQCPRHIRSQRSVLKDKPSSAAPLSITERRGENR